MRVRTIPTLATALAIGGVTLLSASPASAEIPQTTTQKAKVKNGGQKVYSANIGYNKHAWEECKPGAATMEKVVWNLGKVTRGSARIKSIKVRYYNERDLHVGSAYLTDGNRDERWRKSNGWYIPKGEENWRTYKINKTVKFSKNKPLRFTLWVDLDGAGDPQWCHPRTKLFFNLKPNR